MACAKKIVNVLLYFVTNMFSFILNIVSTKLLQKNENRLIDFDAFDLQEIKRVGQPFYIFILYSLILADDFIFHWSLCLTIL